MLKIHSLLAAIAMSAYQPVMAAVSYSCQVLNPMAKQGQVLSKVIIKNEGAKASVTVVSAQSGSSDIQISTSTGNLETNSGNSRFFGKNQNSITQVNIAGGSGQMIVDQTAYKIDCK